MHDLEYKRVGERSLLSGASGGLPSAAQSALSRVDSRLGLLGDAVPFLGALCSRGPGEAHTSFVWEQTFSEVELAFLQGHRVGQARHIVHRMVHGTHGIWCMAHAAYGAWHTRHMVHCTRHMAWCNNGVLLKTHLDRTQNTVWTD